MLQRTEPSNGTILEELSEQHHHQSTKKTQFTILGSSRKA